MDGHLGRRRKGVAPGEASVFGASAFGVLALAMVLVAVALMA